MWVHLFPVAVPDIFLVLTGGWMFCGRFVNRPYENNPKLSIPVAQDDRPSSDLALLGHLPPRGRLDETMWASSPTDLMGCGGAYHKIATDAKRPRNDNTIGN